MKITYSWIKELVDIRATPQMLAEKLSMAGLSVAAFSPIGDDWLYDIEVTSNRPDWLSARGIAREVAAITDAKFKPAFFAETKKKSRLLQKKAPHKQGALFDLSLEDKSGCLLYCAGLVSNVVVGDSPDWLKKKLQSVGLRPVNNVVDTTNYLMLEYGQPLHAFNFDKIQNGKVFIRRAQPTEELVLLDGSCKKLSEDILVIADTQRPLAAAGIMGGQDSEIHHDTVNILLESAYFDPGLVRRGVRFLGAASDSSYRFERGVDIQQVEAALIRACGMLRDMCQGRIDAIRTTGRFSGKNVKKASKRISFSLKKATDVLGVNITRPQARRILEKLGFAVTLRGKDMFDILAPSFRRDVAISEDIMEEIARVYGYDKIPTTQVSIKPCCALVPKERVMKIRLEKLLVHAGFKEVMTYSLTGRQDYQKTFFEIPPDILTLQNPLSQDNSMLRTTLLPGLLACLAFNINHGNKNLEIFEVARIFRDGREIMTLGFGISGARRASWRGEMSPYSLFDIKGVLEMIADEFEIAGFIVEENRDYKVFEPGMGFWLKAEDKLIACFGQVSEDVKKALDIQTREDLFVAEVSVEALAAVATFKKVFKAYALTPAIVRDLSLIVPRRVTFKKISDLIFSIAGEHVYDVEMVECYQGKEIPQSSTGITISIEYRCLDKTLTEAQINPVHARVIESLRTEFSVGSR